MTNRQQIASDWAARGFTCDRWTDPHRASVGKTSYTRPMNRESVRTSGGTSKSPRTTGARTWRWSGPVGDGRCLGWFHGGVAWCIGNWWRRCRVGLGSDWR